MPVYHTLGSIPHKRHTVFRKPDGTLYAEELVSTEGFSSLYSLVYHTHPPTIVKSLGEPYSVEPKIAREKHLKHTSLIGFNIQPEDDFLESRKPVLVNSDLHISLAAPRKSMVDHYYKNSQADEVIFIHEGSGTLKTGFGKIKFAYGDYLVLPRGTIYQIEFDNESNRLFIVESFSPIRTPKRYRNAWGQLMEHSPFCERDIKKPQDLETNDEAGDFKVLIKKQGLIYPYIYGTHPFDFIGWDGFHYPWAFSIHDFEPITGRVHQPPPVHQTFEGHNFVICSFVPRKYDYHPDSIPAPYNHSNVDSDEVLYYVDGDFMSRKSVVKGQITLHPGGIPHGPHPGTVEKSIGKEKTEELAVMIDPFKPLMLTDYAVSIEEESYHKSWQENVIVPAKKLKPMNSETLENKTQNTDFLPLNGTDYLELYVGNAKQAAHFYKTAFGFQSLAYAGPETGVKDRASYVLVQNKIRLVLTTPLYPEHPISEQLTRHGDGVKIIALWVDDAYKSHKETTSRGAESYMDPQTLEDEHGILKMSGIYTYGETVHLFIERKNYKGLFMPGYEKWESHYNPEETGLLYVDHCVGNVGWNQMDKWVKFYEDVMGFKNILTFDDKQISTEYSALMSKVMSNGNGYVKFPINEPAEGKKKSQVEEYLDFYGDEGVQHIAIATNDIVDTVTKLQDRGVESLKVPTVYYDDLEGRVGKIEEDIEPLKELGILVDRDEEGYLLQIFTKPVEDRPTLFFEIIQRKGAKSFGAGNFKALFEALEREQDLRGNL